ncbi:uncharacterized protein LOC125556676 isoform X1 [Nematostella vectensis]|uniref:uncharacterized protein LOC125556676 isoform X1 n=2 Tax=Nematostella vectensis TaxID=45351 RepID=UPI0020775977|nr:uncharacterized protein LOC125556676 isoform X1 [Nematostella vectensis]
MNRRRNRGNFPSKGKSGRCFIATCPKRGKFFKRLDNHLSSLHRGVSRAENDNLSHRNQDDQDGSRKMEMCLLCGEQFLQLRHHLKNKHNLSLRKYRHQTGKKDETKVEKKEKQECHEKKLEFGEEGDETEGKESGERNENDKVKVSDMLEEEEMDKEMVEEDEMNGKTGGDSFEREMVEDEEMAEKEDMYKKTEEDRFVMKLFDEEAVAEKVDTYKKTEEGSTFVRRLFDEEEADEKEVRFEDIEEDYVRFLVHKGNRMKLDFFLHFMERGGILRSYNVSPIRRISFGELPYETLRDIYSMRKILSGYFKRDVFMYPYPDVEMIEKCRACGAKERGKCCCPVLEKSFYVFCRERCSPKYISECKRCLNMGNSSTHACLDFFFCRRCNEEYRARERLKHF